MHQDYVEYELIGGGPRDGLLAHMYTPTPEIRFLVRRDVFIVSHDAETATEFYHVYRLCRGTQQKLYYRYEGYSK